MSDNHNPSLSEIEQRLETTTPGEWQWTGYDLVHPKDNWEVVPAAAGLYSHTENEDGKNKYDGVLTVEPVYLNPNTYHWVHGSLADLEFIESSKRDVEFLLQELRAAQQHINDLQRQLSETSI